MIGSLQPHVADRPHAVQAFGLCKGAVWYSTHNMKSTRHLQYNMLETHCFQKISNIHVFDNLLELLNEIRSTNTLAGSYFVDLKKRRK